MKWENNQVDTKVEGEKTENNIKSIITHPFRLMDVL